MFESVAGKRWAWVLCCLAGWSALRVQGAADLQRPYASPCVEREAVFEFTEKPQVRFQGEDRYEITFAVKGYCDVTVGLVDEQGVVVRHLASGVLGPNAPAPFQKNALRQSLLWNGKDDLETYVRDPGNLWVRVMLGLKPEFERRLGGTSPYNLAGRVWGLSADPEGVSVISYGVRFYVRRFTHEGAYVKSLVPPPRNLREAQLGGRAYVEYEPGKRAIHAPRSYMTTALEGDYLPYDSRIHHNLQPAFSGQRVFYASSGSQDDNPPALLHWFGIDGSTDPAGMAGRPLAVRRIFGGRFSEMFLTASPDGRWIYLTDGQQGTLGSSCVWRLALEGKDLAEVFAGRCSGQGRQAKFSPGSAPGEFNAPLGLACDAQGNLYVCDNLNGRLQVFSPEGKFLKELPIERPRLVQVHRKSGAIYVHHQARVEGKSVARVSKLASLADPRIVGHFDHEAACMALDEWAPQPMLWIGGGPKGNSAHELDSFYSVSAWRDRGTAFEKALDFEKEALQEAGENYLGRWLGERSKIDKIAADPVREQAYYRNLFVFDLRTGRLRHCVPMGGTDDLAFDRRGYLHRHFNPGFYFPGVGRVDPGRGTPTGRRLAHLPNLPALVFPEVPYDYGVEPTGPDKPWGGVLPVRDQLGAKYFQDGIGVNMAGDVAENCNIYYAPKMEAEAAAFAMAGNPKAHGESREVSDGDENGYAAFTRSIGEMQKRGEEVYFIRRKPGAILTGATLWTFDRSGELRNECAVSSGMLINGVQIDEFGCLYFVNNRTRRAGEQSFLAGAGGTFGADDHGRNRNPFTGTLFKTRGKEVLFQQVGSPVAMDTLPQRPSELLFGSGTRCWVEGAEWLYAGASPIVAGGCSCPTMRNHLDWYRRTFVPEVYRHSIGVLDANGNLILHLGRYGNWDDLPARSGQGSGGEIATSFVNVVAGTDNYLCFPDHGERLVVLKLNYHAEEKVRIAAK